MTINAELSFTRTQFHNGVSNVGGAVYMAGGSLKITSSEFRRNAAA